MLGRVLGTKLDHGHSYFAFFFIILCAIKELPLSELTTFFRSFFSRYGVKGDHFFRIFYLPECLFKIHSSLFTCVEVSPIYLRSWHLLSVEISQCKCMALFHGSS